MWKNVYNWLFGQKVPDDPQGISEFESLIKNVLSLIATVKGAKEGDNKITGVEWLGIGKSAFPLISNAKNYKLLKAQALDFTTEEGRKLAAYCASLGILKADAALAITHAIAAVEKAVVLYNTDIVPIIDVIKSRKK